MFTVLWTPVAERQLTAILLAATDSATLLKAVRSLDRKLRRDPSVLDRTRLVTINSNSSRDEERSVSGCGV